MIRAIFSGPVKPYVRMTVYSKHTDKEALQYLKSNKRLAKQMMEYMNGAPPLGRKPIGVNIEFGWVNHHCDLDNLVKAVFDSGNGILWENDAWIDIVTASRGNFGKEEFVVTADYLEEE